MFALKTKEHLFKKGTWTNFKCQEHSYALEIAYTLDTLFRDLGGCERFQRIFFPLAYFPLLPPAWVLYFMMFGSYNPGWKCHDKLMFNSTKFLEYTSDMTISNTHDNHTFINNETIMTSCDVLTFCENLAFSNEASTIVSEWALICDDSWIPSFIFTIQIIGVFSGTVFSAYLGDRFGRKFSVHGNCLLLAITNIIIVFSVSWKMYAVIQFFIGFGAGGVLTSVAVYTCEFIPAWWRIFSGSFPFWNFSTFTFGLCVLAVKNWRHVHIATTVVSLISFFPVIWLPESLRFLTVHGKIERANRIVRKITRINRKSMPDTNIINIVAEIEKRNMKDRSNYSYLDLFRRSIRKQSIILGMTWFTLALGSYMIGFGLKNLSGDFFLNFFLFTFLSCPLRLVLPCLITKIGSKYICVFFLFLSSICSFTVAAVQLLASEVDKNIPSLVFSFGASLLSDAAWGAAVVLGIELFPTGVRAMAYGVCNASARIGTIIAPFTIPKDKFPIFGSFLLLGGIQIIISVSLLTLPESRGRPLPDNLLVKSTKQQKRSETEVF